MAVLTFVSISRWAEKLYFYFERLGQETVSYNFAYFHPFASFITTPILFKKCNAKTRIKVCCVSGSSLSSNSIFIYFSCFNGYHFDSFRTSKARPFHGVISNKHILNPDFMPPGDLLCLFLCCSDGCIIQSGVVIKLLPELGAAQQDDQNGHEQG